MKTFWHLLVVLLGALGLLVAFQAVQLLFFGVFSASGTGRVAGSALMAVLLLLLAANSLSKARSA
jgi:hypothetical protein